MQKQPFEKHVWAEIDLDALRHNFRAVKARAGDLPLCAVVKADSYGHGAVQCARVFAQEGAAWLAVSCLTEAVQLRQDGQTLPILILGHVQPEYAQTLIHEDITVACYSTEQAQNLSAAAVKAGGRVKIHLKADTGMGRIGFALRTDFDAAIREMLAVCALPGLEMTGLFQHFAVADEPDPDSVAYTRRQFDLFCRVIRAVEEKRGRRFPLRHCANTGATACYPEMHLDMVRPGLLLYGYGEFAKGLDLRPVMTLKTTISTTKTYEPGTSVSYGRLFTTQRRTRMGVVPYGYADGFFRCLSGRCSLMTAKGPAPQRGRICMDMSMIDLTDLPGVDVGDEVEIFGPRNPVETMAAQAGTIPYELTCAVSKRVPRVYLQNGQVTERELLLRF